MSDPAKHLRRDEDKTVYRIGAGVNVLVNVSTLILVGLGLWRAAIWTERQEQREKRQDSDIAGLSKLVSDAAVRPDLWTGTNMYTFAGYLKEWNPELAVANPSDIQSGRRVTKIKLPEVGVIP